MKSNQTIEEQYISLEKQSEALSYVAVFALIGAILCFGKAAADGELYGRFTLFGAIGTFIFLTTFFGAQAFSVRANLLRILSEIQSRR